MTNDEYHQLLLQIASDIAGLRAAFAPRDPLVDAIHVAIGEQAFTAGDILRYANQNPTARLVEALDAAGAVDARALGRFFSRMEGRGLLKRVGNSGDGVIWEVVTNS